MNIQGLIQEISLGGSEVKIVNAAKENLIQTLQSYSDEGIIPTIREARIIGSYGRKTKISPLDDVDILLVMGVGHYAGNNWHIIDECSYPFANDDKDEDGNISSIRILNTLRNRIVKTYSRSEVRRNDEVVNVYLSTYNVGFDLVPCFYYKDVKYFLMPAGSGSTRWKKTNPEKDDHILDRINNVNGYKIKDVIKLAKQFFRYKKIKSLRSYHLEACAYYIFDKVHCSANLADYLAYFYSNLTQERIDSCPDPTGLSERLTSGLSRTDIGNILSELKNAVEALKQGEQYYCEYVGFSG